MAIIDEVLPGLVVEPGKKAGLQDRDPAWDGDGRFLGLRPTDPAASTSMELSHLLPCRLPAGLRLPADS